MAVSRSFRLAPLAEADMEDVWRYSATQWSVGQAETYGRELLSAFHDLAAGVRIGSTVSIRPSYLRLLVGSHVIFYKLTPTTVDIIRILHQSMDMRRHL